ncbi:MAG: hypothetical protein U9O86_05430 [Campylobacterota bacterium]|nr:hypothetical protein [Campylobacterota bacterium]
MFKQTIRTNIVSIFLLLVGAVSFSLLASQYYFNHNLAVSSTTKTFNLIAKNISEKIEKDNRRIKHILKANVENKYFFEDISFDYNHPAAQDLIQMMRINRGIYAMYFAQKDGSFFEIINMNESPLLYDRYKAPSQTRWTTLIHIDNKIEYTFLDKNLTKISSYSLEKKYNPLSRPWYRDAINSKKAIMTEPYLFTNLKKTGTTYAMELNQAGTVFAIDFTLKKLNHLLSLQTFEEDSEIFLFNNNGNKIASSANNLNTPSKNSFTKKDTNLVFTKEEEKYIQETSPLVVSNEED